MRKTYCKPLIEIESFKLSTSIAANCSQVINMGPGIPGVTEGEFKQCTDFGGSGFINSITPGLSIQSGNKPFYESGETGCDCYYESGGNGYFTS